MIKLYKLTDSCGKTWAAEAAEAAAREAWAAEAAAWAARAARAAAWAAREVGLGHGIDIFEIAEKACSRT